MANFGSRAGHCECRVVEDELLCADCADGGVDMQIYIYRQKDKGAPGCRWQYQQNEIQIANLFRHPKVERDDEE